MKIHDLPPIVAERAGHMLPLLKDIELPRPTGWHVLVMQFVRPNKVGSIIMANKTQAEDKHQGRVGLVLALGPRAYADLEKFGEKPWVKPGDWAIWPAMTSAVSRFEYGAAASQDALILALLNDDQMLATDVDPMLVLR